MNTVELIGRLAADPYQIRPSNVGFNLLVTDYSAEQKAKAMKARGEQVHEYKAMVVDCYANGLLAKVIMNHVGKGRRIQVIGHLVPRPKKHGNIVVQKLAVVARLIHFLDGKDKVSAEDMPDSVEATELAFPCEDDMEIPF